MYFSKREAHPLNIFLIVEIDVEGHEYYYGLCFELVYDLLSKCFAIEIWLHLL